MGGGVGNVSQYVIYFTFPECSTDKIQVVANPYPMKILIVEDRQEVAQALCNSFKNVEHVQHIHMAHSYDHAVRVLAEVHYNVILIDIDLPDRNGIELCRTIRARDRSAVIIFVSGFIDDEALRQIFAAGGNDTIRKPFSRTEIALKAVQWWQYLKTGKTKDRWLIYKSFRYDLEGGQLLIDGKVIPLTKAFRRLIMLFMERPETVISNDLIQREIWGDHDTSWRKRNIRDRIYELKKRLPRKFQSWIQCIPGEGYLLQEH